MKNTYVGAGVGGLTLTLALRARGLRAQIFEQARALGEIGAAVALSANSTRELRRPGLLQIPVGLGTSDDRRIEMTALEHRLQRRKGFSNWTERPITPKRSSALNEHAVIASWRASNYLPAGFSSCPPKP